MLTERVVICDNQTWRIQFFARVFTFRELRAWLLDTGLWRVVGFDELSAPPALGSLHVQVAAAE